MSLNAQRAMLGSVLVILTREGGIMTRHASFQVGYQYYSSNITREVERKCIPQSIALLNGRVA